ncbi:MAG: molecular chaperone HtpG [Calditrichaeota bacterium]|nr:molecular chaperone HtpG [Calditrichota bacterium]MCB0270641.1 molecular chaperone HtpG [Calditrichota bacterium]MCB9070237.1 molecular chaperone HtpG [Calditrichia bacterium]
MAKAKTSKAQEFEYQAELKQLLKLIVHSLYTHPEVFLRELISNASDALNKVRFRMLTDQNVFNADAKLEIRIDVDEKKHTFSISDSGIGMNHDDLVKRIGTVASSGTLEFIEQMKKSDKKIDADMIGQFGVGFYSVFMVTDEVIIETRHADVDAKGYRWKSDGQGTFTIEEIDKPTRGTTISFTLNEQSQEFSQSHRLGHIINKYSNFVDFPILLNGERANKVDALWHRNKSDIKQEELNEFYKFVANDFQDPVSHLHLSIEGAVNFKAIIFFPATAPGPYVRMDEEKSLQLYSHKVFIQDDAKELLPEYLRFVKGVVDTEDLPLNVSREVTQNSPAMSKIRSTIVNKILSHLEDMAKQDPGKFQTLYNNFGQFLKFGVNTDFSNRDRLVNLMRFESTTTEAGAFTTLKDYVTRMNSDQKEIYYVSGETRSILERNPNLEYFKKHDIEVLLLTDPADVFIVPSLNEYEKKPIKSIDNADIDVKKDDARSEEALNENLSKSLITVFKETLGDKVEDVMESHRLVDSPATLVIGKQGMDPQMEKMMKMMQKDFAGSKRILEINTSHPLIKNLSKLNMGSSTDALLRQSILQIYEGAALLEGTLKDPTEFVTRMTELMVEATK